MFVEGATGDFEATNGATNVSLQTPGPVLDYRQVGYLFWQSFLRYNMGPPAGLPNRWAALVYNQSAGQYVGYAGPADPADCEGVYMPYRTDGDGDGGTMRVKWWGTSNWW